MKTEYFQLRASPEERKRWEKAAKKEGISVSEFLRRAGNERAQQSSKS
jgi:uncharacterized protein (DUF1778 family)